MAIPNYTYLKLKILEPRDVITVSANHEFALLYDVEKCELATQTIRSPVLRDPADHRRGHLGLQQGLDLGAFKPTEDAKALQINPEDSNKVAWIGTTLSAK
ncbi:uncharacterized protein [Setaria viridis]|uniref:uncharacterized protein n=1 Tax=Setaria viridis TaxID=4556 RepID=UPI003B3B4B15